MFIMKFSVICSDISDNLCTLYFVKLKIFCTSINFWTGYKTSTSAMSWSLSTPIPRFQSDLRRGFCLWQQSLCLRSGMAKSHCRGSVSVTIHLFTVVSRAQISYFYLPPFFFLPIFILWNNFLDLFSFIFFSCRMCNWELKVSLHSQKSSQSWSSTTDVWPSQQCIIISEKWPK